MNETEGNPRRGKAVVILSVLVTLFAVGAGVFGVLFVLEKNKHADTVATMPGRVAEEVAKQSAAEFEKRDRTLAVVNADLVLARRDMTAAVKDRDGMANTIRDLMACASPAKELIRAAGDYSTAEAKTAIAEMTRACR